MFFAYFYSEVGISRMYANSQKLQLVGIARAVSMAASVMNPPVGEVWHRADDGQLPTFDLST